MSRQDRVEADALVTNNAFRVLGLDPGVDTSLALERANEIQAYLGIERVPAYESDFRTFSKPERSVEAVGAAVQRIETPRMRLIDEATWFHLRDPVDVAAAGAMAEGHVAQARSVWEAAVSVAQEAELRLHYQHNLAVLNLAGAECPAERVPADRLAWQLALTCWGSVLNANEFWRMLAVGSPASRDPRFSEDLLQEVRLAVGQGLTRSVRGAARAALTSGDEMGAARWIQLLLGNRLPHEIVDRDLDELLAPIASEFRQEMEWVRATVSTAESQAPDIPRINSRLAMLRQRFDRVLRPIPRTNPWRETAADALAEACELLGGYLCSSAGDARHGIELLEEAAQLASSEAAQVRIRRHTQVRRWSVANEDFGAAMERRDVASASAALASLEAAHEETDPPEIGEMLARYRQAIQRLRVLRGSRPIKAAPSLFTLNGFGTRIYFEADVDQETGTYVGTRFLTALFLPVLAVSRYRMRAVSEGGYEFFGQVPLGRFGWTWNAVVAVLLLAVVIGNAFDPTSNNGGPRAAVRREPAPSAPTSAPPVQRPNVPTAGRSELKRELDRRGPKMEASQAALKREDQVLDQEREGIRQLRARIERRRALNPDGLIEQDMATDRLEVAEHNQRLDALRRRTDAYNQLAAEVEAAIAEFNTTVERYNSQRR